MKTTRWILLSILIVAVVTMTASFALAQSSDTTSPPATTSKWTGRPHTGDMDDMHAQMPAEAQAQCEQQHEQMGQMMGSMTHMGAGTTGMGAGTGMMLGSSMSR